MKAKTRVFAITFVILALTLLAITCLLQSNSTEAERIGNQVHVPARNSRLDELRPGEFGTFSLSGSVTEPEAPHELLLNWLKKRNLTKRQPFDEKARESLRAADFFDCSTYELGADVLQELENARNVKWLMMGRDCKPQVLAAIGKMTWLRGLAIGGYFHEADFSVLGALVSLEYLDMSGELPIARNHRLPSMPNLEVLYMRAGAGSEWRLPGDRHYPSLKVLDGASWNLTDDDIKALAIGCPGLHYLNVSSNSGITEASIPHFLSMKNLRYLHIGTTALEQELIEAGRAEWFRSQLPRCYVGFGT